MRLRQGCGRRSGALRLSVARASSPSPPCRPLERPGRHRSHRLTRTESRRAGSPAPRPSAAPGVSGAPPEVKRRLVVFGAQVRGGAVTSAIAQCSAPYRSTIAQTLLPPSFASLFLVLFLGFTRLLFWHLKSVCFLVCPSNFRPLHLPIMPSKTSFSFPSPLFLP